MPSEWYETFGRTIVEAYAAGTPVIASRMGAMEELLVHEETGLLFEAGSASALSQAVSKLCRRSDLPDIRRRARREFEDKYSIEQSYRCLMSIYERAFERYCRVTRAKTVPSQRFQEQPSAVRESLSKLEPTISLHRHCRGRRPRRRLGRSSASTSPLTTASATSILAFARCDSSPIIQIDC